MLLVFSTSSPFRFYSKLFHRKALGKYFVLLKVTERSNATIRIVISHLCSAVPWTAAWEPTDAKEFLPKKKFCSSNFSHLQLCLTNMNYKARLSRQCNYSKNDCEGPVKNFAEFYHLPCYWFSFVESVHWHTLILLFLMTRCTPTHTPAEF